MTEFLATGSSAGTPRIVIWPALASANQEDDLSYLIEGYEDLLPKLKLVEINDGTHLKFSTKALEGPQLRNFLGLSSEVAKLVDRPEVRVGKSSQALAIGLKYHNDYSVQKNVFRESDVKPDIAEPLSDISVNYVFWTPPLSIGDQAMKILRGGDIFKRIGPKIIGECVFNNALLTQATPRQSLWTLSSL